MSLIGPRPALPTEVDQYPADLRRRLAVKPGLTGLWQVSGRSDLSWEDTVRYDLSYVDNWSWALDFRIAVRTVTAVVGRDSDSRLASASSFSNRSPGASSPSRIAASIACASW